MENKNNKCHLFGIEFAVDRTDSSGCPSSPSNRRRLPRLPVSRKAHSRVRRASHIRQRELNMEIGFMDFQRAKREKGFSPSQPVQSPPFLRIIRIENKP